MPLTMDALSAIVSVVLAPAVHIVVAILGLVMSACRAEDISTLQDVPSLLWG